MSVEVELKKMLEANGYTPKKTKIGSIWTYEHEKYMIVNYHNNDGSISFNYLGKYMRDAVKKTRGSIIGLKPAEKEFLYKKALSNLPFYGKVKNSLTFSLREKGGDYVHVSDKVGIDVLGEILRFIVAATGEY